MPKTNMDDENEKPYEKNIKKTYELTFEDTKSKFIVIISKRKKNKLRIKILDSSQFHLTYISDFSYNDLQKISKFFWLFKDIDSIIYELDNLFLDEKVMLTLDLEHNIVLKFITELNTRNSIVLLKIENKDADKMKEMGKIMALVEEQKGIIRELNKENRKLKKQMEKNGYKRNSDDEDEDEEDENKGEKKNKTSNSFLPQNGSLYDKKLVKPIIDRKEEEKKEDKKEEEKKEDKNKEKNEEKKEEKKDDIKKKEDENIIEDNKEEEKIINDIEDVNDEEKEKKPETEAKEENKKEKSVKKEDILEKDLKSESKKDESIFTITQRREQSKHPVRENKIDYQFELEKLVKKSRIFKHEREIAFLIDKINQNLNYRHKKFYFMRLIYRASDDGDTPYKFHRLCDGLSPLIVLIKTTYNKRFGGFTEAYFEASEEMIGKRSNTAFLFNLDKEKAFDIIEGQNAICCHKNYGPVFYGYEYCNIYLVGNFLINEGNVARKGDRYKTNIDYEINDGKQKFVALDIEIYHVTLTNA